jgi:hypothetical protein
VQSRERIINIESDNAGLAFFVASLGETVDELFNTLHFLTDDTEYAAKDGDAICIFGEWCGGNIQKGVALNGLPKMFVIFGAKFVSEGGVIDPDEDANVESADHRWLPIGVISKLSSVENQIYNIYDFPMFMQEIDFEKPHLAQIELIKFTEDVECECPVGAQFGSIGVGEGCVWEAIDGESDRIGFNTRDLIFKVKGEKHSVSKVKTLAAVDVEKVTSITEFTDKVVTDNRCKQGLDKLREQGLEIDTVNMGPFIRWLASDIFKEELDTLIASGLTPKDVGKQISNVGRNWFMKQLEI